MSNRILCVGLFILTIGTDLVNSCCPDGWTKFGSSCYFFGHEDLNFQDAERYCEHLQATLVNIETSRENTFLQSYLRDFKEPNHWIGLTDIIIDGSWNHYPSETASTYFNWGAGQPNGHKGSNCAAIWASFSYNWVDEPCTNKFRPLCEKALEAETTGIVG
ncbi:hypothetical protein ACF0H5_022970 [Mactra antiquata]